MPTARELLEQAEALMQRERAARMNDDIPTLTDSVPTPRDGIGGGAALDMRRIPTSLDDIPMLTEAIEDFDTPSIPLAQSLDDELAMWRETDDVSIHVAAPSDTTAATEAPAFQEETPEPPQTFGVVDATIAESSPPEAPIDSPPTMGEAAPLADDSARWKI